MPRLCQRRFGRQTPRENTRLAWTSFGCKRPYREPTSGVVATTPYRGLSLSRQADARIHLSVTGLCSIVVIAVVAFCATNVDDLVLLFSFLANRSFHPWNVIVGYAVGMLTILALSWIGALFADLPQPRYVGFLGFVPIGLGLKHLYCEFIRHQSLSDPGALEFSKNSQIAAVAIADLSQGQDTIVLYSVLLFKAHNVAQLAVSLLYIILVFVWCLVGLFLLRYPALRGPIQRYGHRLSPYLMIGVGAYIVLDTMHSLAS